MSKKSVRGLCKDAGPLIDKTKDRKCRHSPSESLPHLGGIVQQLGVCQSCKYWVPSTTAPVNKSPVPLPVVTTPCAKEGAIIQFCENCGDKEGRHVRECEKWKFVTREPVGSSMMNCQKCKADGLGYVAVGKKDNSNYGPDSIVRIDSDRLASVKDGRKFNCSVIDFGDLRLMAYRTGWVSSRLHIATLGKDLQPESTFPIDLQHPRCSAGREDPRLFVFRDTLYMAFAGVEWVGGRVSVAQMVAQLDSKYQVTRIWEPAYANRTRPMEKNWQFFQHDSELYCVYGIAPDHKILHIDSMTGDAKLSHSTPTPTKWSGGLLRGGCPPVRVGTEYYHWFHGFNKTKRDDTLGSWYDYSVGVYTFDAKPPFKVRRMTPHPVWLGDPSKLDLNVTKDKSVIYPCGVVLDGDKWLVSAGHQDWECFVASFGVADIERQLEVIR